jgi:uncharacterized RDD family membrane protein YckC
MNDPVTPRTDGLANLGQRVVAFLIDALIVSLVSRFIMVKLNIKVDDADAIEKFSEGGLLNLLIHWLYFAGMESSTYRATLGKLSMGMYVGTLKNHPLTFAKATGRYFGKILSTILFGLGFIMAAFNDHVQTLHDKLSGTLVFVKQQD